MNTEFECSRDCLHCRYDDCVCDDFSPLEDYALSREMEAHICTRTAQQLRRSIYNKVYQEKHRETFAARKKAYYQENREAIAARQKAYREENRETIAAKRKAYREKNREAIAAREKVYRKENREAILARRREAYQKKRAQPVGKESL